MEQLEEQNVRLLSREGLRELGIDYCNVHLLRLERSGNFPPRIRLSPYRVVWSESEIKSWIAGRLKDRG